MTDPADAGQHGAVTFTPELWAAFWSQPDSSRVGLLAADVVGHWPGDTEPVRGQDAYRARIAEVLDLVPDLRLDLAESAADSNCIFIHWVARRTGGAGALTFDGIDRILLDERGLVKDNLIRYDPDEFARLVRNRP